MPDTGPLGLAAPSGGSSATWAIVLAGGRSSRFGTDKTAAPLGRADVLGTLLAGIAPDVGVVVVGPFRDLAGPGRAVPHPIPTAIPPPGPHAVRWTREDPPGGGPVAGLAAGAAALPGGTDIAVLLGGDQPFAGPAVPRLLAALDTEREADAAMGVAPDGSRQLLCVAVRVPALLAALPAEPAGRSVRSLAVTWRVVDVPLSAREALDVDTPADLARAETLS